MNLKKRNYIALDIGKNTLRVQIAQRGFDLPNNERGFATLVAEARKLPHAFVLLEATGGYERGVMAALYIAGVELSLLNPARVRDFIKSEGIKAKNDKMDAIMLLRFGQEKHPRATPKPDPVVAELAALLDRRSHLTEQLAREKNRLKNSAPRIKSHIREMLDFVQEQITTIEQEIRELIDDDDDLKGRSEQMQAVIGVGEVTAWTILAYLPEIRHLNRNQTVALVGIAPYDKDSATFKGKRRIEAGRAKVRACLYMAVRTAKKHNPVIKAYVDRLTERGKPKKMANVAAMRKMIIHIHSLLKKEQLWVA